MSNHCKFSIFVNGNVEKGLFYFDYKIYNVACASNALFYIYSCVVKRQESHESIPLCFTKLKQLD